MWKTSFHLRQTEDALARSTKGRNWKMHRITWCGRLPQSTEARGSDSPKQVFCFLFFCDVWGIWFSATTFCLALFIMKVSGAGIIRCIQAAQISSNVLTYSRSLQRMWKFPSSYQHLSGIWTSIPLLSHPVRVLGFLNQKAVTGPKRWTDLKNASKLQ